MLSEESKKDLIRYRVERSYKVLQEAKDNGWANITQEQIDNSKWNKTKKS